MNNKRVNMLIQMKEKKEKGEKNNKLFVESSANVGKILKISKIC